MSKSKTAPHYLSRQQIPTLSNELLLNAFETSVAEVAIRTNLSSGVPVKLYSQVRHLREELLRRLSPEVLNDDI